jgi:hypothetical protein
MEGDIVGEGVTPVMVGSILWGKQLAGNAQTTTSPDGVIWQDNCVVGR